MLEQQHQRLAQIIRAQETTSDVADASESPHRLGAVVTKPDVSDGSIPDKVTSPPPQSPTSALAAARIRKPVRDSSPSLARDIASRRGIPQQGRTPLSSAVQAKVRQLSPESHRRARASILPKIPASVVESQSSLQHHARKAKKAEDDEGFAKFYSNLTSGTMSKLSSVLAYAGLPLTADDIQADPHSSRKPDSATVRAGHEPDVKKMFSKAALKAIEDDHRQRGTLGHGFGPAESFYVVPPTGLTTSYRDMATGKRAAPGGEEDEDDFVDARELPGPPSPRHSRSAQQHQQQQQKRGSFGKPRTSEELELENTTLKHTLEQLAARLANFEAHAQDASMAALTQSMASLRPAPDPATLERLRQLEMTVDKGVEERQQLEAVNSEQEKALRKWHAKYAKLRESTKERQRVKSEKGEKGTEEAGAGTGGEAA